MVPMQVIEADLQLSFKLMHLLLVTVADIMLTECLSLWSMYYVEHLLLVYGFSNVLKAMYELFL